MPDDLQAQQDALTILRAISSLPNLKERIEALEEHSKRLDDSLREITYGQKDFQRQLSQISEDVDEIKKAAPEIKKQKEMVRLYDKVKNSIVMIAFVYVISKASGFSFSQVLKIFLSA